MVNRKDQFQYQRLHPEEASAVEANNQVDMAVNHKDHQLQQVEITVADQAEASKEAAADTVHRKEPFLQLHLLEVTVAEVNKALGMDRHLHRDLQLLPVATEVDPANKQADLLASPRDLPLHQVVTTGVHPASKEADMVEDSLKDQLRDQWLLPPVMQLDQVNKEVDTSRKDLLKDLQLLQVEVTEPGLASQQVGMVGSNLRHLSSDLQLHPADTVVNRKGQHRDPHQVEVTVGINRKDPAKDHHFHLVVDTVAAPVSHPADTNHKEQLKDLRLLPVGMQVDPVSRNDQLKDLQLLPVDTEVHHQISKVLEADMEANHKLQFKDLQLHQAEITELVDIVRLKDQYQDLQLHRVAVMAAVANNQLDIVVQHRFSDLLPAESVMVAQLLVRLQVHLVATEEHRRHSYQSHRLLPADPATVEHSNVQHLPVDPATEHHLLSLFT